ncbi:MAG: hypothetical protein DRP89_02395, partial [Candidatus Neomarinimicrobiota bacterium]
YKSDKLEKIRSDIKQFKKNLKKTEAKEKSLLTKLHETEENISLTEKMISHLNRELKQKEREIQSTSRSIKKLENNLSKLKSDFAKRLVNIYKKGEYNDWELILTSRSLNQAIYRYKYLRIISNIDKNTAKEIRFNITTIDNKKHKMIAELEDKEKIINEKKIYQNSLSKQKNLRKRQINKARRDKNNLLAQIKEKEKAAAKLLKLIANLEKEREIRRKELTRQRALSGVRADNPFLLNQGKLLWPVRGKIVSKFGTQRNPVLKTITENSGIDIKAEKGTPVKAILDGVVTTITYIRGFGNTIIIDHGSGFYTVYTHVENVHIYEKQYVLTGTVIANVGESGTLSGSILHFEIWKNKMKLNPEDWLIKRT